MTLLGSGQQVAAGRDRASKHGAKRCCGGCLAGLSCRGSPHWIQDQTDVSHDVPERAGLEVMGGERQAGSTEILSALQYRSSRPEMC